VIGIVERYRNKGGRYWSLPYLALNKKDASIEDRIIVSVLILRNLLIRTQKIKSRTIQFETAYDVKVKKMELSWFWHSPLILVAAITA
jgi:hypothetical protein